MAVAAHGDRALLTGARDGVPAAAEQLVERHWRALWRTARLITGDPATAEDVVQDALVAALVAADRFDPAKGSLGAWLQGITANRAINAARRRRRHWSLESARDVAAPQSAGGGDAAFLGAVAGLRPQHRAVLVLRYGLDMTPPEIAQALGVRLGTVNSRLARALEALRATEEVRRVE